MDSKEKIENKANSNGRIQNTGDRSQKEKNAKQSQFGKGPNWRKLFSNK
jgi:hypothetical protein